MYPIFLVIRNNLGQYFDDNREWSDNAAPACVYGAPSIAFRDAYDIDGVVWLRFPSGREIPVSADDFNLGRDYWIARERGANTSYDNKD